MGIGGNSRRSKPLVAFILRLRAAVAVAVVSGVCHSWALGAEEGAADSSGKSWAIPWLVVVLTLALGIFITLRPAGRESEIKRDRRAEL